MLGPMPLDSSSDNMTPEEDLLVAEMRTEKLKDFCMLEEKSHFSAPTCGYYFDHAYKQKLIFYLSQCHTTQAYQTLLDRVHQANERLQQKQKELSDDIISALSNSSYEPCNSIYTLINITRQRLTFLEFYYSNNFINESLAPKIRNDFAMFISNTLSHLSMLLAGKHIYKMLSMNYEEGILLSRSIYSIYASLRYSKILSNVKEINDYCFKMPIFLDTLCTSYLMGYGNDSNTLHSIGYFKRRMEYDVTTTLDSPHTKHMINNAKHFFNLTYFQQITGEHFQSLLKISDLIRESTQKACLFKRYSAFLQTHYLIASAALDNDQHELSMQHLDKLFYYITESINCLFDNQEIPYENAVQISINDNTLLFSFIEPGLPRIEELKKRIDSMEDTIIHLCDLLDRATKKMATSKEQSTRLNSFKETIKLKKTELLEKRKELKLAERELEKNATVLKKSPPPIVMQLKKDKSKPKPKPSSSSKSDKSCDPGSAPLQNATSHSASSTIAYQHITSSQSIFKPTTSSSAQKNSLSEPERTRAVHISEEERKRDKELKREKYNNKNLAESTLSSQLVSEPEELFPFEFAVFGKPVNARLDKHACSIYIPDELECKEAITKFHAILGRARVKGPYGQGIKLIEDVEKSAVEQMFNRSFSGLVFKLKAHGDKLRVYGEVIQRGGKLYAVLDMFVYGKVHKKIDRMCKSIRM